MGDVADRAVGTLVRAGALGGVLGDVSGQGGVGDLPVSSSICCRGGRGDFAEVQLRSPAEHQRCPVGSVCREGRGPGGRRDSCAECGEVERGRWRVSGSIGPVEADDGVEVHQPAALVFGDFGVGQPGVIPELDTLHPERGGQRAAKRDGEPCPQRPGVGLPEHRPLVVVGIRVERSADPGVVGLVSIPAAARDDVPADGQRAGVHRAEGGCGEGEERPRVPGHGVGHVLGVVPGQPGAQQVEGVGGVAVRARRAHGLPAVAARGQHGAGALEQHGAVAVQDPGAAVQVDGWAQPPVAWTWVRHSR